MIKFTEEEFRKFVIGLGIGFIGLGVIIGMVIGLLIG
jgi:hypothetical protein